MILIACAGAFAYMLTFYRVPDKTVALLTGLTENPILILLDDQRSPPRARHDHGHGSPHPHLHPDLPPGRRQSRHGSVAVWDHAYGEFGPGSVHAPVGSCLFVGCAVGKLPMEVAVRTIWPFYLAIFAALMMITFIPAISLTLPRLIGL